MMKKAYRLLAVLMFGILSQAMTCEEEFPEYIMSEGEIPQVPYLTTISAGFFQENIVGHGWKWKASWLIGEDGYGTSFYPTDESGFVPNDYYFGTDSMTVFVYRHDSNERHRESFSYDATNNLIISKAIVYMQLVVADSTSVSFIERLNGHYYKSTYERMLPYELNARWNGSKPEKE